MDVQEEHWLPRVGDRSNLIYRDDDVFSRVSSNGSYPIDTVRSFCPGSEITVSDGGAGFRRSRSPPRPLATNLQKDDMDSSEVLEDCRVPIITEIGPYYDDGDVDALTPADIQETLIENFVLLGVAQVSVFGTGESNHCMDLMGLDEQLGIHAAVEYLGKAHFPMGMLPQSGNHMMARQWEAAAMGSPHLKTIVPTSQALLVCMI